MKNLHDQSAPTVTKKKRTHERQPSARVAIKAPPAGVPDAQGWRVFPVNLTGSPHVRFVARAAFPGFIKPVERRFRDHASAVAWADEQNAKLVQSDPQRGEPLLNSRELGDLLKLSPDSLFGLRQRGLPYVKISCHDYRYRWSEVSAFLNAPREPVQVAPKPFLVEPWKMGGYRFRVRGTGQWADETRGFKSEANAIQYAATRNRAVGLRPNAPAPRHARGMDPDGPFCQVSPLNLAARPDLKYRAYVYFEGQKHAKEWQFRTEAEALHFANRKNLEFERERTREEAEHAPAPELETLKLGQQPALMWTQAQIEGVDSGHHYDPVKGPPFRIHATAQNGYSFLVCGPTTGKGRRERSYFKTEREAKTYAHMRNTEVQSQGLDSLSFPAWLRVSSQRCHEQLSARGKTIEDATRHYLEYLDRTEKSIALGQLITLCLAAKKHAGFTKGWLYLLRRGLEKFANSFGKETIISEITAPKMVEYISGLPGSPSTRNAMRMILWTLFSHAEKTGYITSNPVRATIKEKEISAPVGIFTAAQVAALLEAAPAQWLPFLAIGAFAGLRTQELLRLDWAQVDLVDGFVEVTAKNSKSARRRLVKILPALEAYIRPFAKASGPVSPCMGFIPTSHIPETLEKAGIANWPRNALRHSFASYHIAHFRDAAALALEMGHTTTGLIFAHYRQVVKSTDGARWWALRPSTESAARKVVSMTSAPEEQAQAVG